jgi:hypothetical protein
MSEDQLLLSCARKPFHKSAGTSIAQLVTGVLDWDRLVRRAFSHRLLPLLFHCLKEVCWDKVPETGKRKLEECAADIKKKNLRLTGELVRIIDGLREKGISAVPYKGPVLAHYLYGEIGLRQFDDLVPWVMRPCMNFVPDLKKNT